MGYFPFYIDIEDKKIVVVGGGNVALRKIKKLLLFDSKITVVAPYICQEVIDIPNIEIFVRDFEDSDLDAAFAAISATDDPDLNQRIFKLCTKRNILVNTVDNKEKCTFIFPSLIKKDNLTVGISTGGESPLYARYMRERIENILSPETDEIIETLKSIRPLIKREISSQENRKIAFERIFLYLADGKTLEKDRIQNMIGDLK